MLLIPSVYGNNNVEVYYNIDQSLPQTLESSIANKKLGEDFNMNTIHIVMLENGLDNKEKNDMIRERSKAWKASSIRWG